MALIVKRLILEDEFHQILLNNTPNQTIVSFS